ncbi:MAG TPA: septation ring formation regulator EzrA [Bacillales bacterium]|nr:septation ring formation regulator EzrA [Bacillales bacterium]
MVYYILALIGILIGIIIFGSLSRRNVYRQIDRLESRKIEIMNRPVTEEISKVKRLKMTGQTEAKFERWRNEWDDIVTVDLPEVEERLFEAEEAADRFRFGKAKAILNGIQERLERSEKRIEELLEDLRVLISSEQQNREDIVALKAAYHELKKKMLTGRRHFQKAIVPIEAELADISRYFENYEHETEEGNYLEARSILLEIQSQIDGLQRKVEHIPQWFTELQTNIPEQIKELREGFHDMEEQGFILGHLKIDRELKAIEGLVDKLLSDLEQANVDTMPEEIEALGKRLERIYDELEKEVASRKLVPVERKSVQDQLAQTEANVGELKSETELVQLSYRIEQEDLQIQDELESETKQLRKRFAETEDALKEQKLAFSIVQEKLETMKERLDQLEEKRKLYREMLDALREDELKAKKKLLEMKRSLLEAKRLVQKSNLPGLPSYQLTHFELAEEKMAEVDEKLNKKPLEMNVVNRVLEEALEEVAQSCEATKKLVEDADLAERLIQYGNRYRSKYPSVKEGLNAAENAFRNYSYEEALEFAAKAIETVEPHILKEFDVSLNKEA